MYAMCYVCLQITSAIRLFKNIEPFRKCGPKTISLLCMNTNQFVSYTVLRAHNIKRHYSIKHLQRYENLTGQIRSDKINCRSTQYFYKT